MRSQMIDFLWLRSKLSKAYFSTRVPMTRNEDDSIDQKKCGSVIK